MSKIATYQIDDIPTINDMLIGTDADNWDQTKNFRIGDILALGDPGALTLTDDILYWDSENLKYVPYLDKIVASEIAYLYLGTEDPDRAGRLNLDAHLWATEFSVQATDGDNVSMANLSSQGLYVSYSTLSNVWGGFVAITEEYMNIYAVDSDNSCAHPILIGQDTVSGNYNGEHLLLDDLNQQLDIAFTSIYLTKGTPLKWLALDINRKIVFQDAPTGGGVSTLKDNILFFDNVDITDAKYKPYTAKKSVNPTYPYLYTGTVNPSFYSNRLNLDSKLYASNFLAYAPAGSGAAIIGQSNDSEGVIGTAVGRYGVLGNSTTYPGVAGMTGASPSLYGYSEYASTDAIEQVLRLDRASTGAGVIGIGGSIAYYIENTNGMIHAGDLVVKLTDVTTSANGQFEVYLTHGNVISANPQLSLGDNGRFRLSAYGSGNFMGTATKWLAVDASGYLIEETAPSGGGTVSLNDYTLQWNNTNRRYQPYATKKPSDPAYAYFYSGSTVPTFLNRLNLDGHLYATKFNLKYEDGTILDIRTNTGLGAYILSDTGLPLHLATTSINGDDLAPSVRHQRLCTSLSPATAGVGIYEQFVIANEDNDGIDSGLFACKMTDVTATDERAAFEWYLITEGAIPTSKPQMVLSDTGAIQLPYYGVGGFTGTATKWLAVDASGNVIEEDIPVGGLAPVDDILDWDTGTNKYMPYAAKKGVDPVYPYFYTGTDDPTFESRLNLDGILHVLHCFGQVASFSNNTSAAVIGVSAADVGVFGTSTSSYGVKAVTGNSAFFLGESSYTANNTYTVLAKLMKKTTSGSHGQTGIGGYLEFDIESNAGATPVAATFGAKLTNATNAAEDASFEWMLMSNGTLPATAQMILSDTGAIRLSSYGSGTFTGTVTKWLAVDVSGNVVEVAPPTGGGVTPTDEILEWDTDHYAPYATKKVADPSYPYFYIGADRPDYENRLNLDGSLYVTLIDAYHEGDETATITAGATIASAIYGYSVSAIGIVGTSDTLAGVAGFSYGDAGGMFERTDDNDDSALEVIKINRYNTFNVGANGIGAYIGFHIQSSTGVIREAARFSTSLTDATNLTADAQFEWWLSSDGGLLADPQMRLSHDGSLQLPFYGIGTFSGSPTKHLGVDNDGYVVEFDPTGLELGDWTEDIMFDFRDLEAGVLTTYVLDIKASFDYTIDSAVFQSDGTLNSVSIKIDGTSVTGLNALRVDTSILDERATAANTVTSTNQVTLVVGTSHSGDPTMIRGKLRFVRL